MDLGAACSNPDDGYAVRYPSGWHTNPGEVVAPCRLFHPAPIEVPPDSEIPFDIAVIIGVEQVPFEQATSADLGRRVLAREPAEVAGRPAALLRTESTGDGLLPAGVRGYHYYVDLGERTLSASTFDAGEPAFATRQQVLDAMVATLTLPTDGG